MKRWNNGGITLIALVITVIILLILVGISITMLTGKNGLLKKAQNAREEQIKAQLKEELEVEIINIQMNKITNGKEMVREDLKELEKIGAVIKTTEIPAEGEYKEYYFEVDENYKVKILDKIMEEEITTMEQPKIVIEQISDESFTIKVINNYKKGLVTEYKYYIEGEMKNSGTTNKEYTIGGLAEDTQYSNIYVEASFGTEKLTSEKVSTKTKEEKLMVNKPKVDGTGLIPIKIEDNGSIQEVNNDDKTWYNYAKTSRKWANAKTADGSIWVWIPRFAYKITYKNVNDKSQGGTIDVVFLKGTTSLDAKDRDVTDENYVDTKGVKGAYIVHPVFKDGRDNGFFNGEWDKEITGFWMSKFAAGYAGIEGRPETAKNSPVKYTSIYSWWGNGLADITSIYYGQRDIGTSIKYPIFQANRAIIDFISIRDIYDLSRNLTVSGNPYKLENVDSHMTKNSEWGAVAYLTHSKYGRNGENVTINNIIASDYCVTGYASQTNSVAIDESRTLTELLTEGQAGSWTTEKGKKASSTGNIFGIYDLNGVMIEYVAGYVVGGDWYEDYGGQLKGESSKYKTKYIGTSDSSQTNYKNSLNLTKKGEAIWETSSFGEGNSSWFGCESTFCNSGNMGNFLVRGRRK